MKGLLRGMVAVGLLAGGLLSVGCGKEQTGPNVQTPITQKYQPPEAKAGQQAGDQRKSHPTADDEERWRERSGHSQTAEGNLPLGGGTTAPGSLRTPEEGQGIGGSGTERPREGLGLGLAESYQAPEGQGGAELPAQDVTPEQRRRQQGQGSQGVGNVGQQAPTTEGQ